MYENGKMRMLILFQEWGKGEKREWWSGMSEFNYDIF
jgi:hypothetical protein